jgi:NADPH2:quinone reductase
MEALPSTFKALVLHGKDDIRQEEISYDFENLDKDHLVIKVSAAGLGPYDLGFASGRLPPLQYGLTFGVEGSGIVVKVGSNCDALLVGKRVAFLSNMFDSKNVRSLAEYAVVTEDLILPLSDSIDDNQGAYLIANPATAYCLFESTIKGHTAIVQDVASSALGKMITRLAKKNNIKIINIVRKEDNVKILSDLGSDYSLNSSSSTYQKELTSAINDLQPSLYITYQGGIQPSIVMDLLPNHSTMCVVGNINNQVLCGFSSTDFIFKGKKITGFQLFNYFETISLEERKNIFRSIAKGLIQGDDTYRTEVQKVFKLSEWSEARKFYEDNMSKGKIVFSL